MVIREDSEHGRKVEIVSYPEPTNYDLVDIIFYYSDDTHVGIL